MKNSLFSDFNEYSGIPLDTIESNVRNFRKLTNDEWDQNPSQDFNEKAVQFYKSSKYYIYDLLAFNSDHSVILNKLNRYTPLILKSIKKHKGMKFLDFGGGLGLFSEIVAGFGKEVTYLDIPGQVSAFALWRFRKYNLPVNTIISDISSGSTLEGLYDIIFTDAVIEHVTDSAGTVDLLCKHLNDNGLLILLVDLDDLGDFHMHRRIDIRTLHCIIEKNGLVSRFGKNKFCSIWLKNKNIMNMKKRMDFFDFTSRAARSLMERSYLLQFVTRNIRSLQFGLKYSLQKKGDKFRSKIKKGSPVIYVMCPDDNGTHGGIKYLYNHVDSLNRNGFQAAILHSQAGFRCTWFDNRTEVIYRKEVRFTDRDYLAIPERYEPDISNIHKGVKKVILNQNAYNTFHGYSFDKDQLGTSYRDRDVIAVFCTSEHTYDYLKHVFPGLNVFKGDYGIDSSLFRYNPDKEKLIAYMPRKTMNDALNVINILKFRNVLKDFEVVKIHNASEAEVANVLQRALLFLSFSDRESFGLPPAEAMSCGCLVVGYHGIGGLEFFKDKFCYPVPPTDILTFARTVEKAIQDYKDNKNLILEKTRKAAEYIHARYSMENQESDIVRFWNNLIR